MPKKESNCACVVCQVERSLLDSLSTQIARTHFQALAANHTVLNHFDSPADVVARLHEHERVEAANHNAWDGILHALVEGLADRTTEDIGQQLLLVAYTPAIHKVYREVCQKFPGLCAEDVAQQAALCFLETARSPEMHGLNGHLPAALAIRFRRRLFRWAIGEVRQSLPLQEVAAEHPEPPTSSFEHAVTLEKFLQQAKRDGLLSEAEYQLLRKHKWEGFGARELADRNAGSTTNAVQMRVKRIIKRLRRAVRGTDLSTKASATRMTSAQPEEIFSTNATIFSGEMGIRNSEGDFSPELSHVPRPEHDDISQIPALMPPL